MQPGLSGHKEGTLDALLLQEGWSLHQRLEASITAAEGSQPGDALERWQQVVAPDSPLNFGKRLGWDGLSTANAAWALDPPATSTPQSRWNTDVAGGAELRSA